MTVEDALPQGAMDIIAQQLSEDLIKKIRNIVLSTTKIETSQKKDAERVKEDYLNLFYVF